MRGLIRFVLFCAMLAFGLHSLAPSALAHQRPSTAALLAGGLAIADVTHGEMAVLAAHADAIRALAAAQSPTDPTFRRLANFAELQRTWCLWGLVPGSIADEESPFNACSHATLAALKAVLLHMRGMPRHDPAVDRLADGIAEEMAATGASLVLCRYSNENFNTAALVIPQWTEIFAHPPSLVAISGALALAGLGVGATAFGLPRLKRRASVDEPDSRMDS